MMSLLRKYEVWWFLGLIIVVNALFVSGISFEILSHRLYSIRTLCPAGGSTGRHCSGRAGLAGDSGSAAPDAGNGDGPQRGIFLPFCGTRRSVC